MAGKGLKPQSNNCRLCQDKGIIIENDIAHRCNCVKQRSLLKQFKYANITAHMSSCSFNNFSFDYYSPILVDQLTNKHTYRQLAQMAFQAAQEFVDDILAGRVNTGLMFSGPVGSGKTFLSACIANTLLEHEREVLFTVVPDLLDEIKETFNRTGEQTELQLLSRLRNVEILILDDLGVHNYTPWTQNKLYGIINHRLNQHMPTIITTNLDLEEIDQVLGERTTSRIVQMCKVYRMLVEKDIRHIKHLSANKS